MYKTIALIGLSAVTSHAQGLGMAMYVPHALETVDGTTAGTWMGQFEAPLTRTPKGGVAEWAAFCVDAVDGTCFSEPVSEIASGNYTNAGELVRFTVTNIPPPSDPNNAPGVVCYVATVFDLGQICSKPVLNYTEVGLVSNGNNHWAARNIDVLSRASEYPLFERLANAAKETVDMIQKAFGNLQRDTAQEIEEAVQAFDADALQTELAGEFVAIADAIRPEPVAEDVEVAEVVEAVEVVEVVEAAEAPEVYGTAVVTPLPPAPEPMPEPMPEFDPSALQAELADEFVAIADAIRPEPVAEAIEDAEVAEAPEVYGTAVVTPLPPAPEPMPEELPMPMPSI